MEYNIGDRVELFHLDEPHEGVEPGATGTVRKAIGGSTPAILVDWDNGKTCGVFFVLGDVVKPI